jgi:hypothetical protein
MDYRLEMPESKFIDGRPLSEKIEFKQLAR